METIAATFTQGSIRRVRGIIAAAALLMAAAAPDALCGTDPGATNEISAVTNRFRPLKPTLIIDYEANYELLWIDFARVATATIRLTEGLWNSQPSGQWDPACLLELEVRTLQKTNEIDKARLYINKQTVCTLSLPDLHMIKYAKFSDERLRPYFGKNSSLRYVETYNFEGGSASYTHRDIASLTATTNMPGIETVEKQSRELDAVLARLNAAYEDKTSQASTNPCVRIHFSADGAARTFGIYTQPDRIQIPILDRKIDALHSAIKPEEAYQSSIKDFDMWCMPLRVLTKEMGDTNLQAFVEAGITNTILPVSGHYELFMGRITCTLTGIRTQTVETVLQPAEP